MTITDSFLSNAGWLFFTAWSVILGAISVAAFGRDLLPSKINLDPGPQTQALKHRHQIPFASRTPKSHAKER